MKPQKKVFRSRISVLLLLFILAIFLPISIQLFQDKAWQGFYFLGGALLFVMFFFTGMYYIISGSKLYCKIWFIRGWSANITDILSVVRSYNPLSSPASSLKRLCISFKKGTNKPYMLISPVREKAFIEALKSINPDIDVIVSEKKGKWRIWDWDI